MPWLVKAEIGLILAVIWTLDTPDSNRSRRKLARDNRVTQLSVKYRSLGGLSSGENSNIADGLAGFRQVPGAFESSLRMRRVGRVDT